MIVAYFKKNGETNYAKNFFEFLKYYGRDFDPAFTGISLLNDNEPFFALQKEGLPQNTFTMLDNINIGKNLGQASYNINIILHEFKKSLEKLDDFKHQVEDLVRRLKTKGFNTDDLENIDEEEFKALTDPNLISNLLA